ncbi:MAG: hypothetical protein KAG84_00235 [Bacteroidales bacterium]|nr:hypothetical protein [Bacteroidales bacterium]
MIKESVKKYGDYSLEIKFKFRPEPNTRFQKFRKYKVDTYFFLPREMGVNVKNYTKKDFYREINSYIKIDPINIPFDELVNEDDELSRNLVSAFVNLIAEDEESVDVMETLMKVYLNVYKKSLKREIKSISKAGDFDEKTRLTERLLKNIKLEALFFRSLSAHIKKTSDSKVEYIYNTGNEYFSTVYIKYLYILFQYFGKKNQESLLIKKHITENIDEEHRYRNINSFPIIIKKNFNKNNEKILYRWSVIYSYINNKLIIATRFDKENKWLIQFYYSLAAGIAMIFATGIAFYYNSVYGNFTAKFFIVLVISYMFKDRIKDWIKDLINFFLKKETYDHTINIFNEKDQKIGLISQGFSFIPTSHLPKDVLLNRQTNIENEIQDVSLEKIMHYKSKAKINASMLFKMFKNINIRGVNDITYFNTSPLLMRMEKPDTEVVFLNSDNEIESFKSEKVYHINMILKYEYLGKVMHSKYRIVLNRNGIKKVEKVQLLDSDSPAAPQDS